MAALKLETKCRVTTKGASNATRTVTRILEDPKKVTVSWTDAKGKFHERDEWVENLEVIDAPVMFDGPPEIKYTAVKAVSEAVHDPLNPLPPQWRGGAVIMQGGGSNGQATLQIETLKQECGALKQECDSLRAQVAQADSLREQVIQAGVAASTSKLKITDLEAKLGSRDARVMMLNRTIVDLQGTIVDLQGKVESAEAIAKQEGEASAATAALFASAAKDCEVAKGELVHVKAQYDAALTERAKLITEVKHRWSPVAALLFAVGTAIAGVVFGGLIF